MFTMKALQEKTDFLKKEFTAKISEKEKECLARLDVKGRVDHKIPNSDIAKRRGQHLHLG